MGKEGLLEGARRGGGEVSEGLRPSSSDGDGMVVGLEPKGAVHRREDAGQLIEGPLRRERKGTRKRRGGTGE